MEWRLNLPPFPPLQANDDDQCFWCADDVLLPALWPEPVHVIVQTESEDDDKPDTPSNGQQSAFAGLKDTGGAVRTAALQAMFKAAQAAGRLFGSDTADELAQSLSLSAVHLLDAESEGTAYVGLEFYGPEYEHGFGVILHRDRVVHLGVGEHAGDAAWTQSGAEDE